jgi:hypothetical protein
MADGYSGLGQNVSNLDPTIALKGPYASAPDNSGALGQVSGIADTMGKLNSLKLFNKTYAARIKAGQIISAAPTLEKGLEDLYKDPNVAPFAGELVNSIRQGMLAQTEQGGKVQEQAQSGLAGIIKALPGAVSDPSMTKGLITSQLATLSPQARALVAPAANDLLTSLTDGLPTDPQQAQALYKKRLAGIAAASGMSQDTFGLAAGKPSTEDIGGQKVFGLVSPTTGEFDQKNALNKTIAPQIVTMPGGVPMPVGGGGNDLGGGANPARATPLTPNTVPSAPNPNPAPIPPPNAVISAATGGVQMAGNGQPLELPPEATSPYVTKGIGGMKVLSPAQQQSAQDLQKEFATSGAHQFTQATNALGNLDYMVNALDQLNKAGGFQVPGAGGEFRNQIAKSANTVYQMANPDAKPEDLPFSPSTVASAENLMHETTRMGLNVVTTLLGNQREAAETIINTTKSVPGIDNTYLGAKLVASAIKSALQRTIDMRNFENAWQQKNQGNLNGAIEAFNQKYPADTYAEKVLGNFGLTPKGFASPEAVGEAYKSGLVTKDQMFSILKKQFPDKFK